MSTKAVEDARRSLHELELWRHTMPEQYFYIEQINRLNALRSAEADLIWERSEALRKAFNHYQASDNAS